MTRATTTLRVDLYVIDTLMPDLVGHDHRASAFIVYLFFLRQGATETSRASQVSLARIAEGTGLSRRSVQDAIALLKRRRLLSVTSESRTAVPEYVARQPWAESRRRVAMARSGSLPSAVPRSSPFSRAASATWNTKSKSPNRSASPAARRRPISMGLPGR